eukprot:scaffold50448_cov21-Tisochrysis_lutea.AAC.1
MHKPVLFKEQSFSCGRSQCVAVTSTSCELVLHKEQSFTCGSPSPVAGQSSVLEPCNAQDRNQYPSTAGVPPASKQAYACHGVSHGFTQQGYIPQAGAGHAPGVGPSSGAPAEASLNVGSQQQQQQQQQQPVAQVMPHMSDGPLCGLSEMLASFAQLHIGPRRTSAALCSVAWKMEHINIFMKLEGGSLLLKDASSPSIALEDGRSGSLQIKWALKGQALKFHGGCRAMSDPLLDCLTNEEMQGQGKGRLKKHEPGVTLPWSSGHLTQGT